MNFETRLSIVINSENSNRKKNSQLKYTFKTYEIFVNCVNISKKKFGLTMIFKLFRQN